jgi:hypothetical protein
MFVFWERFMLNLKLHSGFSASHLNTFTYSTDIAYITQAQKNR